MSYNKSITTDFSGVAPIEHQLQAEIKAESGITTNLQGISRNGDTVTIIFDSALSGGEETLLNTVISNHTPDNSKPRIQSLKIQPSSYEVNTSSYMFVARVKYEGSLIVGDIDYIEVVSRMTEAITSYDVRVIRQSDMQVIVEKTGLNNTVVGTQDLGLVSNTPEKADLLEVYVRKTGGTGTDHICIDEVVVYYGN